MELILEYEVGQEWRMVMLMIIILMRETVNQLLMISIRIRVPIHPYPNA
jgi:hypothetical protein